MATIQQVRDRQPAWFSRGNKRFFGDLEYRVLHGKLTKRPYLIRATNAWSDMFDRKKTISWRLNLLAEDLKIRPLIDDEFKSLNEVKDWLITH